MPLSKNSLWSKGLKHHNSNILLIYFPGQRSVIMDTQLPGEGAFHLQEMEEAWHGYAY